MAILANLHAGAAALAQADDGIDVVNRVARSGHGTSRTVMEGNVRDLAKLMILLPAMAAVGLSIPAWMAWWQALGTCWLASYGLSAAFDAAWPRPVTGSAATPAETATPPRT
jgi:hypothetical protein